MSDRDSNIVHVSLMQPLTDVTCEELKRVLADPVAMKVNKLTIAYLAEMYIGREHYDINGQRLKSPWEILEALAQDGCVIVVRRE